MEELKKPSIRIENSELLPGLPEELALLCLARLPLRARARCRSVSRALRRTLNDNALLQHVRRKYGISAHTLVFLCLARADSAEDTEYGVVHTDLLWVILDPLRCGRSCDVLFDLHPPPVADALRVVAARSLQVTPGHRPGQVLLRGLISEEEFHSCDACDAGLPCPIADEIASLIFDLDDIVGFDVTSRRWCSGAEPEPSRCGTDFGWAHMDGYVYVAGGWSEDDALEEDRQFFTDAERYSFTTKKWEGLPSIHEKRQGCSGFAMNGCFYLLGGLSDDDQTVHSGEFFNPNTSTWTLVPNMWPYDHWLDGPPYVAVVNDQLYALKPTTTQIIRYETLQQRWISSGSLPKECPPAEGHRIVGVGHELWVLLNYKDESPISVLSCTPQATHTITDWRTLFFNLPGNLRILDCVAIEV